MNDPIEPAVPQNNSPSRPRRPWWYWLLLFLPATIAVVPVLVDWASYRSRGGADATYGLGSGVTFGLAGMGVGLITAVFIASWEARRCAGKAPAAVVAIGTYLGLQVFNLGLTLVGCNVGLRAIDSFMR